jgi:hypothetical protein
LTAFHVYFQSEAADILGVKPEELAGFCKVLKKKKKYDRSYFTAEEIERIKNLQESFYDD